ncbi:polysaccharide deacetylase family protein [Streptomyces sp. NPDC093261]|uniref:polysaccharide deacetylase family protein n=1 Tax=Streptomyces sp. NPDC093261 TaxID=3366037 RepID=UPI003803A4E2
MTAAALVATLAGAVLTACGPHTSTSTSAQAAPSAAYPSASAQSPTAPGSASDNPTPSRGVPPSAAYPSVSAQSPTAPGSTSDNPTPSRGVPLTPSHSAPLSPPNSNSTTAPGAAASPGSSVIGKAPGGGPLADPSISRGAAGGGKTVALTFDDGPDPRWTPQILALLAQHHAKATFCEIGPQAQRFPYLTKAIKAAGDRLCDHSVHHNEQQDRMSVDYNTHEIVDAQRDIADAAGAGTKLWYYRAPGGDFTPWIRAIAAQHDLRPLGWSDDANDWRRPGVDGILRNVDQNLRPGAVILMHDGGGDRSQTVQALARLLDQLDAQGYSYGFPVV